LKGLDLPENGRKKKYGGPSCCHCSIRRLSHRWASSFARHLGGDVCSRHAPDSIVFF
jgi:hypothetical protein